MDMPRLISPSTPRQNAGCPPVACCNASLSRRLQIMDDSGLSLPISSEDAVTINGVHTWNWTNSQPGTNQTMHQFGKVIIVKYGEVIKRIGIDGTDVAIKDAIKSTFGLRSKRGFWLEDEAGIIRSLDSEMPLGVYNLCLDEGVTVKIYMHNGNDMVDELPEEKTFYTEEGFQGFLKRRGWLGLREVDGFQDVERFDELRPMCVYRRL